MWSDNAPPPRRNAHAYALARMVAGKVDERAELRREVEQLKQQLEETRERERRRIAREMHDSTVQDLVAIGLAYFATAHPVIALGITLFLLTLILVFATVLVRFVRRRFVTQRAAA